VVAYGRFITAVVHVLIIGTVLFFIVRAADRLFTREKKPTEVEVLAEIRDELRAP
jgi:large conductance mechanosensitive channel